jgi:type 1 glutamine amidotransferase
VVFLSTTGDILNEGEQSAFEAYIKGGGGYVGIHSAADTEYDWPFYGELVGAYFLSHPQIQEATITNEAPKNPLVKMWPAEFKRTDEWYDFRTNPRSKVTVLCSILPGSHEGSKMPGDHPIVWCHDVDMGRAFYSGFGHTKESYAEKPFREMIYQALRWVTRT